MRDETNQELPEIAGFDDNPAGGGAKFVAAFEAEFLAYFKAGYPSLGDSGRKQVREYVGMIDGDSL